MDKSELPEKVLTKKQREFLSGDFDPGSDQNTLNYRSRIRKSAKLALYDLQLLYNLIDQTELEHREAFGEGHTDSENDPVSRGKSDNKGGRFPNEFVNENGDIVDPDPDINPDARHRVDHFLERLNAPKKAKPETQEALIDSVAFLCRAAEAGELKIPDVLEKGFERYHEDRQERQPNESEKAVKVTQRTWGGTLNKARTKLREGKKDQLTRVEWKVLNEYRSRD